MKWVWALFVGFWATVLGFCPFDCECKSKTLHCQNLNSTEIEAVIKWTEENPSLGFLNASLINCSISNINSLPSVLLNGLFSLDLSANNLSDFRFSSSQHLLPLLIDLNLSGNQITGIPRTFFVAVPNIEEIHLERNRIFSIDWEAFRLFKLRRLFLSKNNLLTINDRILRFTPNLEYLDLSGNQLISIQSSSFFSARRLRHLDLSFNRIQRLDYDSFVPMHQLQSLDLAFNNFTQIPIGLQQFEGIRFLNLSGNPIERIQSGDFRIPVLQTLILSDCPKLHLIEANAFADSPNLQNLRIENNPKLTFLSPNAFQNNSLIFEILLKNNSLGIVQFNGTIPSRVEISKNPLECECLSDVFASLDQHIVDATKVECSKANGRIGLAEFRRISAAKCPTEAITPMGTKIQTDVGKHLSMYCVGRRMDDLVVWEKPNGEKIQRTAPRVTTPDHLSAIHSLSMQSIDLLQMAHRDRLRHSGEQLQFETVLESDAGQYICHIERADSTKSSVRFDLTVRRPPISVFPLEVGSHYVALGWNGSLHVQWTENVRLMMAVRDSHNSTLRVIQLNILNPWYGYNVLRLKPETNYTFCLFYEFVYNYNGPIFETCTQIRTHRSLGFWTSLEPSTVAALLGICIFISVLFCFRFLYTRFYIWHQTKARARMNQSVSGQSFLSHSVSAPNGITYDNPSAVRLSNMSTPSTETERTLLSDACV